MFSAHEKSITSICWSPEDSNIIASCSISGLVFVWDLEREEEMNRAKLNDAIMLTDWAPVPMSAKGKIALALENGDVYLWDVNEDKPAAKLFNVGRQQAQVLRWHPSGHGKLLVGTAEGALDIWSQSTGKKVRIVGKSKTSKDPVCDAQWDFLSEDYFLAAFGDGTHALYDFQSQREIMQFEKQSQCIRSMAWARSQPGNFLTSTDKVGVLKLWNVSQRQPLSQIKVGASGVNCIKAIPSEPNQFVISFKNSAVGVVDIATRC